MHKNIQQTLIAGALATMLSSVAFTVAAADGAADELGAQAPIPQVPVRALRPNAPDGTRNVDAFSTAKPVEVGGAASLPLVYQLNNSSLIAMRPGQNIFVPIAVNHPNRFLTPFKNPQVVHHPFGRQQKGRLRRDLHSRQCGLHLDRQDVPRDGLHYREGTRGHCAFDHDAAQAGAAA